MIRVAKHVPLPPRDLRLPSPPLVSANRFRLKLGAPDLNWYPGWGSNPQALRRQILSLLRPAVSAERGMLFGNPFIMYYLSGG